MLKRNHKKNKILNIYPLCKWVICGTIVLMLQKPGEYEGWIVFIPLFLPGFILKEWESKGQFCRIRQSKNWELLNQGSSTRESPAMKISQLPAFRKILDSQKKCPGNQSTYIYPTKREVGKIIDFKHAGWDGDM